MLNMTSHDLSWQPLCTRHKRDDYKFFRIEGGQQYQPRAYNNEPDASNALTSLLPLHSRVTCHRPTPKFRFRTR